VPTPEDYEKYRKVGLKENFSNFNVNDSYVKKKVDEYVQFNPDYTETQVIEKIKIDPMFRSFFLKDPIRQNMYEKVVSQFISKIPDVKNFGKPKPALYIANNELMTKEQLQRKKIDSACKSIDFYWDYKGKKCYAYHKYAKEPGGHQDNQYNDLLQFIKVSSTVRGKDLVFFAIADGEYFNSNDGKVNKKRIEHLRDSAKKKNVFGLTSEEIPKVLSQLC